MRALVKKALHAEVKAYNTEHSFVVSGVGVRRLRNIISQISGIDFAAKRDGFSFKGVHFSIGDGGDLGGDGLWITTKDGLPHPDELREIREQLERLIEIHPPSRKKTFVMWMAVTALLLVCVIVCFATLRTLTDLPVWAAVVISIPSGVGLFYIACKWSEM